MTNINKLRKETQDIKKDAIAKSNDKIEEYILKLMTEYYYSYVNNDMDEFHAAADQLEEAITVARGQYSNMDNYINYCKVIILTKIMNTLFKRDESLDIPADTVAINTETNAAAVNLLERVKQKRMELKKLQISNGYLMGRLLKMNADADIIADNINILDDILSDEAMGIINNYINQDGG